MTHCDSITTEDQPTGLQGHGTQDHGQANGQQSIRFNATYPGAKDENAVTTGSGAKQHQSGTATQEQGPIWLFIGEEGTEPDALAK
eukprot:9465434-Karenia_brevis.AAC.1